MDYDDDEDEKDGESSQTTENINNFGSTVIGQDASAIHCLTIVGQIEGHQILHESSKTTKYEHVMPIIAAVEESRELKTLHVLVNTAGGTLRPDLQLRS